MTNGKPNKASSKSGADNPRPSASKAKPAAKGVKATKRSSSPAKVGIASSAPASKKTYEKATGSDASKLIDQRIKELPDWQGEALARLRALILEAVPEMVEEWKWSVPVWSHHGIICTGESYKKVVKITFAHGAKLADPKQLFNSSLEGNVRRAIDIREGEKIDAAAFKALVKAAATVNDKSAKKENSTVKNDKPAPSKAKPGAKTSKLKTSGATPVNLLSGGNPQIAKADGDVPVQAYIAAMPGWKSGLGEWLDTIIDRNVPNVKKAVKWNSPFYGIEGQGWFLSFHVFTKYVKVTFFAGLSLKPIPPGGTEKSKEARWIDIYENDELDEKQMASWVKQAAAIPGWIP